MICSVPKRIEEDPVEESFIMEVDSALKINLQKLINTLSRSASATLEKALQS
jgi:predicted transcriptional regulator